MFHRFGPMHFYPRVFWWESLIHVLVFAAVVVLVVFLIRRLFGDHHHAHHGSWTAPPPPPAHADPALNEARLRYARGEISRDDYLRIATDLTGQPPPA